MQASIHVVPIQVVEPALFTHEAEVVGVEDDVVKRRFLDISVGLVAQGQLAHRTARVGKIQFQTVLMAVQRHDGQLVGILREADAGDVAVFVQRDIDFACHFRLDVEGMHAHFGVNFARFGILVCVAARILRVSVHVGHFAGIYREGER